MAECTWESWVIDTAMTAADIGVKERVDTEKGRSKRNITAMTHQRAVVTNRAPSRVSVVVRGSGWPHVLSPTTVCSCAWIERAASRQTWTSEVVLMSEQFDFHRVWYSCDDWLPSCKRRLCDDLVLANDTSQSRETATSMRTQCTTAQDRDASREELFCAAARKSTTVARRWLVMVRVCGPAVTENI